MKRIETAGLVSLLIAGSIALAACNPIQDAGQTNPPPPETPSGNIVIGGTEIPLTKLVQVNSDSVTVGGSGEAGAFIANRTVQLSPYAIGQYEVSRRLYMEVMSKMYDDLRANKYPFRQESKIEDPGENATEAEKIAVKGKKATVFVEFLGGKEVQVRTLLTDYVSNVDFSDPAYFSEENLDLPMGSLQWHDAVIFTNYLSTITGKIPVYSLHKYLGWDAKYYSKEEMEMAYGGGGEPLFLYDAVLGQSVEVSGKESAETLIKAHRNPVSWLSYLNWNIQYPPAKIADSLATMPRPNQDEGYTLENSVTNQRFVFNGIDGSADGYRLPTEAEWEFAARGGDPAAADWNYLYAGSAEAEGIANTSGKPVPVNDGGYAANRLGLHHMSGNVCEWVYDFKGMGSDWTMQPITASGEVELNPTRQIADWTADNAMNAIWIPLERIQRGGSYRDNAAEASVLARAGRSKAVNGENRDGFIRSATDYGNAGQNAPDAVRTFGLRLAVYGVLGSSQ